MSEENLPERYAQVRDLIRNGTSVTSAVRKVGVTNGQYYTWRKKFNPELTGNPRRKHHRVHSQPANKPYLEHVPLHDPPAAKPEKAVDKDVTLVIGGVDAIVAILQKGLK